MAQRITRIENAGPDMRARRIFFDDDQPARTTSAAVVKRLHLEVGEVVERHDLESRIAAEEVPLAKERALQLLGYRERSAAELLGKLTDGGYPVSVARPIVERYQEVELVDDTRFAFAWTRSRLSAGYGPRRISRELVQKGIAVEIIAGALEQAGDETNELDLAVRSLRGRTPRDVRESQRFIRRLVSRGFGMSTARAAVESAAHAIANQDDGDTTSDLQ